MVGPGLLFGVLVKRVVPLNLCAMSPRTRCGRSKEGALAPLIRCVSSRRACQPIRAGGQQAKDAQPCAGQDYEVRPEWGAIEEPGMCMP